MVTIHELFTQAGGAIPQSTADRAHVALTDMTDPAQHYVYTTLAEDSRASAARHMTRARVALDEGKMHVAADRMMRARRRLTLAAWLDVTATTVTS